MKEYTLKQMKEDFGVSYQVSNGALIRNDVSL